MGSKLKIFIGIFLIAVIVLGSPWDHQHSTFGDILSSIGYHQAEDSEKIVSFAVSGAEGKVVGEHKVNGSNWSIPNIIKSLIGVD